MYIRASIVNIIYLPIINYIFIYVFIFYFNFFFKEKMWIIQTSKPGMMAGESKARYVSIQ